IIGVLLFFRISNPMVARLEEYSRDLEKTVEERTAEVVRANSLLTEAQRIAHTGTWNWDVETNRLSWSDQVHRVFDVQPHAFGATYEAFLATVHPEDQERVERSMQEALYEGMPYSIDHRIVMPDGSLRVVHEQAEVALNESGQPIRMVGTVQDITERTQTEEALRDSLQLADDLLRAIPSGIYIYEYREPDELILVDANKAAEEMTGIKLRDWKGKEFDEIWPPAKDQGRTEIYLNVARTGEAYESEDVVYADERVDGAFRVRAFSLPKGRLAIAFEDITKQKQALERLRISEEKFAKAFHAGSDIIMITRLEDGLLIDVNESFERILGYSAAEVSGKTTVDLNLWSRQEDRARFA
ncbi:hypothetical protein LCGC14_3047720, partial [marine sediment metagenome]